MIERVFHKLAIDLAPRLWGQSLTKVLLRGISDAMGPAALTRDDLTFALVRWAVDVYHDSPQDDLGGQTPRARWQELVETRGVGPAPDMRTRRLVFGTALERVAGPAGIQVLGIRYQSAALQQWLFRAGEAEKTVELRWFPADIGMIEVLLDGVWTSVPAFERRFDGAHVRFWMTPSPRSFNRPADEHWSAERLAREEQRLFFGVTD